MQTKQQTIFDYMDEDDMVPISHRVIMLLALLLLLIKHLIVLAKKISQNSKIP